MAYFLQSEEAKLKIRSEGCSKSTFYLTFQLDVELLFFRNYLSIFHLALSYDLTEKDLDDN
jgi:hypothetical protein